MKTKRLLSLALAMIMLFALGMTAFAEGTKELQVLGFYAGVVRANEDPIEDLIDEATGYSVTYTVLPSANQSQQLYMELSSTDKYDIVKIRVADYYKLLGEGALMPITDLINEYGVNLKKNIKESSWKATTMDGEIYGIPQLDERAIIGFGLLYRKDILDQMGRSVPSTVPELIDLLKAVKEAYPDMIPMTCSMDVWSPTFLSAFGMQNEWTDMDGTLVHRSQHPKAKEYVAVMRELYQEKLLDVDFPILNETVVQEKFSTGKAFAYLNYKYTQGEFFMPALLENFPDAEVAIIDPLTGENGEKGYDTSIKPKYVTCIPKQSKHAVDAIKFIDAKLETETFRYLTIGTEGETFTREGNRYTPIMPIFTEKYNTAYWYTNGYDEYNYPDYWLARLRRNVYVGDTFDMLNAHFEEFDTPSPVAMKPTIASFTEYETAGANTLSDGILQIITGTRDLDYYDTLAKKWLNEGGQEMTKDINAWYAANK